MEPGERRHLRSLLDALSDDEVPQVLGTAADSRGSWAHSASIDVEGTSVFVKRIPVTAREVERWPSTANHFGLPLHYQYGVGSAGFGPARELAVWEQISSWVDDGATDGFTSLLHQRLLPVTGERWTAPVGRDAYLEHWGGDTAIAGYVDARAEATHELWLVGEHLPHTVMPWLADHQDRVDDVVEQVLAAIGAMRLHDVAHFDAHFGNVVLDELGTRCCLVDLGLASSPRLELAADERAFLAAHRHYDVGLALFSLSLLVGTAYRALDDPDREQALRVCEVQDPADRAALLAGLVDHADRLSDDGLVELHPRYVAALARYRDVILYVDAVLGAVLPGSDGTRYDDAELVARLVSCGVSTSA